MEPWLVQDGEIAELAVGGVLPHTGLRLACPSLDPAEGPASVVEIDAPGAEAGARVRLGGAVEWVEPPSCAVVRTKGFSVLVEPDGVREVPGHDEGAMERWSASFRLPRPGARVAGTGALEVLASYELDFYSGVTPPDICRDWRVSRVLLERRRWVRLAAGGGCQAAGLIGVDNLPRMDRWVDEGLPMEARRYLLDLDPVR